MVFVYHLPTIICFHKQKRYLVVYYDKVFIEFEVKIRVESYICDITIYCNLQVLGVKF